MIYLAYDRSAQQRVCILGEQPLQRQHSEHHVPSNLQQPAALPEVVQRYQQHGPHQQRLLVHGKRPVKWWVYILRAIGQSVLQLMDPENFLDIFLQLPNQLVVKSH